MKSLKSYRKRNFPVEKIRRFLEPGPVVLVSSSWEGEMDIMTMGWHMMLSFSPALVACCISEENHSFELIRESEDCVINIPTADMAETVVDIGNISGTEIDKFTAFNLTPMAGAEVQAPLIKECYANLECRLHDVSMVKKYNLFVFEVVKAHAPEEPRYPTTIHYRGDGQFMVSGKPLDLSDRFRADVA